MNPNTPDTILANRYQIVTLLGEGGSGITYQAKDLQTSEDVAIKILSFGYLEDWKKIELFEREAKILQKLDHPRIPKYIDYFVCDSDTDTYYQLQSSDTLNNLIEQGIQPDKFFLVQEFVRGKNLDHLVEEGWKPDEAEVKRIATFILKILVYLQQLIPPVTHRDIKPQNIIRTETGDIFLVDFGAVQDQVRQTTVGSSVVGTYGYMSPEQLKGGKTYPCTDLYGLGATLIYLLTGKHPADLPQKRLKIDFKNHVNISSDFSQFIDKLIEPNYKDRLPSAQIALEVLQGKRKLKDQLTFNAKKPAYSSIKLIKTPEKLTIKIPSAFNRKRWNIPLGLSVLGWYIAIVLILLNFSILGYLFLVVCLIYFSYILRQILYPNNNILKIAKIILLIIMLLFMLLLLLPHLNLTILISLLILFPEIWVKFAQNILRELLFDTSLEINQDKKLVNIKQKILFLNQNHDISWNKLRLKNDFCPLLTQDEEQWLIQQIDEFLE